MLFNLLPSPPLHPFPASNIVFTHTSKQTNHNFSIRLQSYLSAHTKMSVAPVTNAGEAKAAPKPRTPLPTSRPAKFSVTAGGSTADTAAWLSTIEGRGGWPRRPPSTPTGASDKLPAGGKKGSSKEEEEEDDENEEKVAGSLPKAAGRKYKCPDGSCEKECKHSCSLLRHVKQVHAQ